MALLAACGAPERAVQARGQTGPATGPATGPGSGPGIAEAAGSADAVGSAARAEPGESAGPAEPPAPAPPGPPAYPLDDLPRELPATGRVVCPDVPKVTYRGDVMRYHKPVVVYEGFRDHLRRFEELVRDTAIEVYGRPPAVIRHLGTYNCRRIRRWPTFLSEHGLGNAIDVEGFDFGPAGRSAPTDLPPALRKAFRVRLEEHWSADRGAAALHARFLRLLAQRVIADDTLFRVVLGPAEPGHHNHFHLDMAPWRIVNVF